MAQILDLTKIYSKQQIDTAVKNGNQYEDIPAGGYICKVVDAVLVNDPVNNKANITLHLDVAEGPFAGYFQRLYDRAGFWGLRGYMSFKESQINNFLKACTAFNKSNPGFAFNPNQEGGADIDTLKDKLIGIVTQKEEYRNNSGDIREKDTVYNITEVAKIKNKKFRVPETKKLVDSPANTTIPAEFVNVAAGSDEETPFQ